MHLVLSLLYLFLLNKLSCRHLDWIVSEKTKASLVFLFLNGDKDTFLATVPLALEEKIPVVAIKVIEHVFMLNTRTTYMYVKFI